MKPVAQHVYLLPGRAPNANSYLIGDVLVNAGTRLGTQRLPSHTFSSPRALTL